MINPWEKLKSWLYLKSDESILMVAALRVLVERHGGVATISLEELDKSKDLHTEVIKDPLTDGIRIIAYREQPNE
jgi:hypothetical protein